MFFKKKKEATEEEVETAIKEYKEQPSVSALQLVIELIGRLPIPEGEQTSRQLAFYEFHEKYQEEQDKNQEKGLIAELASKLGACDCGSTRFAVQPIYMEKHVDGYERSLRLHQTECRGCGRVKFFSREPLKGEHVIEFSTKRETGPFRDG